MDETLRQFLYPLGFISTVAFTIRFLIQWISSEKRGKSVVTRPFWYMSLFANVLLWVHSLIQLQIHVALIQACNAVISWRNLNLMDKEHVSFRSVLYIMGSSLLLTIALFAIQGNVSWFRMPFDDTQLPLTWHLLGSAGILLFSSRFFVQWWDAEKQQASTLGTPFWLLSIGGALLSIIYFALIRDYVNLIGPCLGMTPYVRNLILIRRKEKALG